MREISLRFCFVMGERKSPLAVDDPRRDALVLLGARSAAKHTACQNNRREIGLERERTAHLLHDDHGFNR